MHEDFFSKRLTQLRMEKGVSARDMSLSLGQSESYINRIENGKMMPSMTVFFYICDYFDITPQDFFNSTSPSMPLIQIIKDLLELEPDQINHLNAIIKDMKR